MSYRSMIATVAALGLTTSVFAADMQTQNPNSNNQQQTITLADSQAAQQSDQAAQKVDINKASKKELMSIKGINAAKAKSIISYRTKHGDFKALDDLKSVKGFKKMSDDQLKAIEDQLTIG